MAAFYCDVSKQNLKKAGMAGPAKVDAEFMSVVLATYVTNSTLAGTVASGYGFLVTDYGVGTTLFNVGDDGDAFGVASGSDVAILDLLLATNSRTVGGLLYDIDGSGSTDSWETSLRTMANDVYSAICEQGDI